MAITKSSARKDTGSSTPRRYAEISLRKHKGPSSGGIGPSSIGPKERWRRFHVEETKKIIRPFKKSLNIDELASINPYHPAEVLKDVHDPPHMRVDDRQFCILKRDRAFYCFTLNPELSWYSVAYVCAKRSMAWVQT